jgi:HSP20 family protein
MKSVVVGVAGGLPMSTRGNGSEAVTRLLERVGRHFAEAARTWGAEGPYGWWVWADDPMAIDLADRGAEYVVTADLPGYDDDDIDIRVTGRTLRIEAERDAIPDEKAERILRQERDRTSTTRSIRLPGEVDIGGVTARLTNGVLTVTLPKREVEDARTIEIE